MPPTVEECRGYASEYKILAKAEHHSARRSTVLTNISRSWAALSGQLDALRVIIKDEESQDRLSWY